MADRDNARGTERICIDYSHHMWKSGLDMMILPIHSFPENLAICGTFLKISTPRVKLVRVFWEFLIFVRKVNYWLLYIPFCTERPEKKSSPTKRSKSRAWLLGFCFLFFFFLLKLMNFESWLMTFTTFSSCNKEYNIQVITLLISWRQLHLLL